MALTGRYFLIEKGKIVEGPRVLPKAWRNVSGLDKATSDELVAFGWLPEDRTGYEPFDSATQKRSGPVLKVEKKRVTSVYTVTDKTTKELNDEADAVAGVNIDTPQLKALLFGIAKAQEDKGGVITSSNADLKAVRDAAVSYYKANR